MSVYSITYRNGHKVAVPVTKEEYLQIRDSSTNIANLGMARKGNQYAKRSLVQFNYSCYPNEDGTLKGATKPSKTVAMDIDHIEDAKGLAQLIKERAEELDIYMIERTAGGKGLHIVFKRRPEMTNEENIKRMADALHVEPDMGAKDITRVLFTTTAHPNELYLLRDELFEDNWRASPSALSQGEGTNSLSANCVDSTGKCVAGVSNRSATGAEASSLWGRTGGEAVSDDYKGIPYKKIIEAWWKLYYNGETPTKNNRNTLTFELAVNMRHICGFSEAQLQHIIPCYDGFTEEERNECIRSAVSSRKTMMPYRMTRLLDYLKSKNTADVGLMAELEDGVAKDDALYEKRLPRLPMGLQESVAQAGPGLVFPAIFSVGTIVGFYATNVQLAVHNVFKGLSLQSFIVGESGSGKSVCTRIFKAWTAGTQKLIDQFYDREAEWARKAQSKLSGTREKQPEGKIRIIALNNTSANVAERLEAVKGVHSLSYLSEADVVFGKWKGDMETLSSMLRTAYDEDRYDREAKSAEAARCHIPKLLWNTLMCGTPDALYRLITNVTDGFMNRMCIARTPDNTFMPYVLNSEVGFSEHDKEVIEFVVECLQMMRGKFHNEELEQWNLEWMETLRIEALKQGADKVLARMRMRTSTTSARMTMAAYVLLRAIEEMLKSCGTEKKVLEALQEDPECWKEFAYRCIDEDTKQFFLTVTDYMVDTFMYYFAEELNDAYNDTKYNRSGVVNVGLNRKQKENVYDMLPSEFCVDDLLRVYNDTKRKSIARQSAFNMVSRWKQQGLAGEGSKRGYYVKLVEQKGGDDESEDV